MAIDPKETLKELEESLKSIKEGSQDIVDTFNISLVNSLQRSIIEVDKLTNGFKKGDDITQDIKKSFTDITRTQISLSNKSIDLEKQLKKALKENKVIRQDEIIDELTSIKLQQKLNEDILIQLNTLKNLNSQQDIFSNALKKTVGIQISSVKEMLTLTGLMGLIIKGALNYNKYSVETGKALGYSAEKSNEIQTNFNKLAFTTENVNVNSISLNEAFTQLAQSTGYISEYSDDTLLTQIKLTKQVGLTGEEAAQFQRYSVLTGQSSEQVYKSFVKGLVAQRNQSRIGINFKTTLAEAAKISGQLAAQLGYNPERIARAVVKAKEFGMTLEQTAKIGESLLNFESSIENELKAELLTGRQLNLERARAAALSGDQATLSSEIAKNIGTAADFAKMNVLQQKSLAESVGMTADELGETLRKREEALASGKSLAQVTEEEAAKSLERQAIQEKFNAAIEKLQSLIGGIVAGPLGQMLEILIQSVDYINYAIVGLGAVYAWTKSIAAIQYLQTQLKVRETAATGANNVLLAAKNTLLNTQLGKQVAIAAAWTVANPIQALVGLSLAAGVGALIYSQMSDGIIGPGGETVVSGPKGSIQLDKNDSIIAGTNLFDKGNTNQTISPSIDLTPMIAAINQVKASVDRLYSKDTSINMDGKKVGTTLTQGSYKVA
jgi:hypothetical protein